MKNINKTKFSCQRDGLTIRGYEYRPQGGNLPIAIVSHGFMANQMTVKHYAQFLAGMGYAAFCFDFNGGSIMMGKSDGKTSDMSVITEVSDLCAVIEYTKRLEHTDSSNILLMGCSQGGFVSALTAAKLKDQIDKLVLFYPALCIPDDARSGKMMWAKFDPQNIPEIVKCGPMKLGRCYIADVVHMNPFDEIKGYEGDVLIVHGTADKIVNISYAEQTVATYKSEPYERSVTYRTIEGGKHMFSKNHDKIALKYLTEFVNAQW
ncbi:MAG: alpha/beta hydrolase [Oscillospiraceae bacterium]|nr:alpha/beta hydrolase [Oscillospiraceae bacterium]